LHQEPNVNVLTDLDSQLFKAWFLQAIENCQ
jgi:hypothetical protein